MAPPTSVKPDRKGRVKSLAKAPGTCRQLTPGEVQFERLCLATDMVSLVLNEGRALPPEMEGTLRTIAGALHDVLTGARTLR
jgi:hypothetical protein